MNGRRLAGRDDQPFTLDGLEAAQFVPQHVQARREELQAVVAFGVRDNCEISLDQRGAVGQNRHAWHRLVGLIANDAVDHAGGILRASHRAHEERAEKHQRNRRAMR